MTTCKHCGRLLTHPVYEYLGYGRICSEQHEAPKTKPNKDSKPTGG